MDGPGTVLTSGSPWNPSFHGQLDVLLLPPPAHPQTMVCDWDSIHFLELNWIQIQDFIILTPNLSSLCFLLPASKSICFPLPLFRGKASLQLPAKIKDQDRSGDKIFSFLYHLTYISHFSLIQKHTSLQHSLFISFPLGEVGLVMGVGLGAWVHGTF